MKCYTAYFPKPEELPPDLQDPSFCLGDLKLVDGIEAKEAGIIIGESSGELVYLSLSKTRPPEVSGGYVFSGDLVEESGQKVLALSSTTPPRHPTESPMPILLRIRLFGSIEAEVEGFYRILTQPITILYGAGSVIKTASQPQVLWNDLLVVIENGGVIQIRPSGVSPPKDYVIRYTSTGINYMTLADYLSFV